MPCQLEVQRASGDRAEECPTGIDFPLFPWRGGRGKGRGRGEGQERGGAGGRERRQQGEEGEGEVESEGFVGCIPYNFITSYIHIYLIIFNIRNGVTCNMGNTRISDLGTRGYSIFGK